MGLEAKRTGLIPNHIIPAVRPKEKNLSSLALSIFFHRVGLITGASLG